MGRGHNQATVLFQWNFHQSVESKSNLSGQFPAQTLAAWHTLCRSALVIILTTSLYNWKTKTM